MEQIKPGKYVEMVYDLYVENPDGEQLVHQVESGKSRAHRVRRDSWCNRAAREST